MIDGDDLKGFAVFAFAVLAGMALMFAAGGFADWLAATPQSECVEACGENDVARATDTACECQGAE
jgi:hypothetical protein